MFMKIRKEWWYVIVLAFTIVVLILFFQNKIGFSPKNNLEEIGDNIVPNYLKEWNTKNLGEFTLDNKNKENVEILMDLLSDLSIESNGRDNQNE